MFPEGCSCDEPIHGLPLVGKRAPVFKETALLNGSFKEISLDDYKGQYVVLFFYPMDFTFVCPTEIIAFSEAVKEFKKIKTQLIACSTDSQYTHLAWTQMPRKLGGLGDVHIPILADKSMKIARAYGILDEKAGVTFRALFIIDGKGFLRQVTVNDMSVGRSVEETLRLVMAFQFNEEYGDVCPVNWKPGEKTIKPEPVKSKEFFSTRYT
ncbi:unnamed protein product [Phyllotreta striolata]|uniref:thioredoxin-dependent peroxiredoxin n=1 Tax=Phyllotreta striolata TaxID=444603 RepID=A0A9N9TIL9_PHYSR|nr:unnamed protein product [Phyllotreta striolata]